MRSQAGLPVDWMSLLLGAAFSSVFACPTIHDFLKFMAHISMLPFVIDRVLLGAVILMLVW